MKIIFNDFLFCYDIFGDLMIDISDYSNSIPLFNFTEHRHIKGKESIPYDNIQKTILSGWSILVMIFTFVF